MANRKDFHPECTVRDVRLIGMNTAVVRVAVSYANGIALEGGELIPPFSEIHRLALVKVEGTWRISGEDIMQQNSRGWEEGSALSRQKRQIL